MDKNLIKGRIMDLDQYIYVMNGVGMPTNEIASIHQVFPMPN